MSQYKTLFFDLDGTLLDTEGDIKACMREALKELGLSTADFMRNFLIGPPLFEVAKESLPDASDEMIETFIRLFRDKYDQINYPQTFIYPGMGDLLSCAKKNGLALYIATNKRETPTRRLLNRFEWTGLFNGVYAVDSFPYEKKGKTGILAQALADLNCRPEESVMIGDTIGDINAGKDLGLATIAFDRGYGDPNDLKNLNPSLQTSDADQIARFLGLRNFPKQN
ncbi:MAG: HAD family hydrolase [Planctomycetia bacterium]|nr:HAD family hydrolase [Planctomycetia bacterium]